MSKETQVNPVRPVQHRQSARCPQTNDGENARAAERGGDRGLEALQRAADASIQVGRMRALQDTADQSPKIGAGETILQLQADVVQFGKGNQRGGRGYKPSPPRKSRGHDKGTRDKEWRKAIGNKPKPKPAPRPRRAQPQPAPAQHGAPPQHGGQHVPIQPPRADRREDARFDLPRREEDRDEVVIDMGGIEQPHRRGAGERIRDKAFGGRTFGDASNFVGGIGGLIGDTEGATLSIIGGAGVLLSGMKLFYDSLTMEVENDTDRRERLYTGLMGVSNIFSGVYGVESGIYALLDLEDTSGILGEISLGFMAATEFTNIISQLDIIITGYREEKPIAYFLKPIASLLASLLKCIGCVIALFGSMDPGLMVMVAGAGLGVLHGVIKLIIVCQESCGQIEERQVPDIENQLDH